MRTQLLDFLLCRINWNRIFAGNYQYILESKSKKTQSKSRPWVERGEAEEHKVDEGWGRVDGKTFTNWKRGFIDILGSDVYATVSKSYQNCKILFVHRWYFIVCLLNSVSETVIYWNVELRQCTVHKNTVLVIQYHCWQELKKFKKQNYIFMEHKIIKPIFPVSTCLTLAFNKCESCKSFGAHSSDKLRCKLLNTKTTT